jgi:thiol-disulfide isomerase/thioredoxin
MNKLIAILFASTVIAWGCQSSKPATTYKPSPRPRPVPTAPAPAPAPAELPVLDFGNDRSTLPTDYAGGQILWTLSETLMPVLEEAQRINKPVFLEFSASWCVPCKVMEEEIFTQPVVYRVLNDRFINLKMDYDKQTTKTVASIYEVSSLPTILMLDPQGVVLQQHVGLMTVADFQRMSGAIKR